MKKRAVEEEQNEKSVADCNQPADLVMDSSPDMQKLISVTDVHPTRGGNGFVPSTSHVGFPSWKTGVISYFQFVKQTEQAGNKAVTVVERRFHGGYVNKPKTVNVDEVSPAPKLKVGDVVLYKGTQPRHMSRVLVIVKVSIVKGSGSRNLNQIQRFEYETKNLHDGSAGVAGRTVTEAQLIRCYFKGEVFVRVDGLDVLMCVVTEVCKACPFLVEIAQVTLNKGDALSALASSASDADVIISAEYLNTSVLESGVYMVRSQDES